MFKWIEKYLEQRKINKYIEKNATPEGMNAISLINEYSKRTTNKGPLCELMPPSTPRPSSLQSGKELEYALDFIVMKNFLETYPDYKTHQAKRIRKYYGL